MVGSRPQIRNSLGVLLFAVMVAACSLSLAAGAVAADDVVIEGKTEPYRNLLIKSAGKRNPPWSSLVAKILVEEGDEVKKDQILLEFERQAEELDVEMRQKIADEMESIENAKQRELALKDLWEDAKNAFKSTKTLSREEVRRREISYLTTIADRIRLEITKQRELIELKLAQVALENQIIRSPIDGRVLQIFLREGETAGTGDSLLRLVDTRRGFLVGDVEEPIGRAMERGQIVPIQVQTGATVLRTKGTIVFVSPIVDPASGLMPVKVEFMNEEGLIRPGISGSILLNADIEP